ncbi:uncharacterized protein LOC105212916 isoform X2 [Zeugodacus cucurbitae]|uniref:uncharacterized protein LOC105212916 isoform X2 n=1 Tax=Zeugodacus cucurbitae TaxID=28588 RepID=UPI0023D935F3|nr:uncharacterized protein LOC105212916 isoform X2 [Zeugodacus cucurbitae]
MISKLWILICATQLVIINGNYDPAFTGIKTRHHHRAYSTVEQEPYTNTQQQPPYESGPTTNYGNRNYGVSSVRLSNTYQHHDGAHTHQQPSYNHHHHQQPSQQQQQQHQQQQQTSQQVDAYQQRELPLYNRNAHVRHSPSPTQRSERRENVLSGVANTIPDYGTGCPPQHTGPVPYAYDCRRFVNCWHGRGHIQSCGPGTVFNPETLECDRPDKVVCGGSHTNGERREQQTTLQSATQQNKYRAGRLIDGSTDSVQSLCPNGFSGLAPHPTDCTKFLNCANGNTHVQNCGPGTAFSASKKVCDFKDKVDCSDRANAAYGASNNRDSRQYDEVFCPAGASGLYPHPYDCTRFLNCAHGQMAIQSCGPGTAFDPAKLICDFLHKVNCTSTTTIKPNLNYVDTSVKQNALEGEVAKEEGDIFCPPGVSGHFPYPFDYTKFINCKNGNTAIQNCVSGTAYSISRNYCESKENMPRTDHVAYIVSEVSYEYSLTIVSCPPSTDGRHLYPYDFTKYVSCRQGHMSIIACAAQNVYSFSERRCLPEHQVNIGDRVRSAWELQYNVEHTVSKSAALNHLNELLECPQGQTGLYPHPFDYKKYLQCLDGRLTIESCASGYVFSLSSKHCDPKDLVSSNELVQLTHDIGQITESAEENDYFSNNPGGIYLLCPQHVRGLFLYPFDCTKYLGCRDGQGQVENCVADKVFSISRRECINRNHVDAYDRVEYLSEVSHEFSTELKGTKNQLYEPNCLGLGADGLYPHAYDNTKFIKCVAGQATVEVCNNGMIFSKSRKYCDYARNVYEYDSGNDGYNTLTKDHWVQDNTNTLTKDHWVQDNTNTLSEGKTADDGIDVHIVCPPNSVGMYPHPNDCRKFFSCANGIAHIKDCSPGTAWSVEMEVCDFEKNVNCTGRTKPYTADDSVLTENKVSCPFNANGLFLHPFNAYQYIECTNGETSLRKCPPGSVFSISRRLCLVEEQVTNLDHVMCIQEYITDITLHYNYVICPANALGYFIYPFDGLLFIECKAGHTIIQNCGPNMLFSLSNMICIPSAEAKDTDHMWLSSVGQSAYNGFAAYDHSRDWGAVDTTGSGAHTLNIEHTVQTAACPADATGLYPHPTDCTKYLRCANGITYIMDCGPGTAFNAALEVCDFKEKVDCPHSVEFNNVALGHSRDPISQTIACPEGATGLYPHPLDCRKFLNCANGITNIQDCGPGTAWNAKLETCDFIKNVDCSDTHNVYGHNPNTNYQSPPAQSNYRGSTQIGWRQQYDEHSSSSQRGTANDRRAYGSGSSAGNHGDRWSNMDVQRPIPGDATYSGTYSADYDRQERLPTYGRELQQSSGSSDWIAAGSAIDRQTPTQSVIYEEGSLQPNRNYNTFSTYTTPLAPFKPEPIPTSSVNTNLVANEETNIYYAQPVGSGENTEEVFDDPKITTQSSNRSPFVPNNNNFEQNPNKWIAIPNQVLLPPKRTTEPQTESQDFPSQNIFTPGSYITPPPGDTRSSPVDGPTFVPQNNFDSSNLYGGLQPPPPPAPTIAQTPLPHISNPIHKLEPSNPTKGRPSGRSIDEIEPIRAFSTNAQGKPHLLSSPSSSNVYKTDISTSTPATYLQPPALPTPAAATATKPYSTASTRLKPVPVHNLLQNTTIAMFPKDPHYSGSYSNVVHASPPRSVDFQDVQNSEDLVMADALRLLLRPYFNRSGTISEENADIAESHIMKLSPTLTSHTSVITASTDRTSKNSPVGAENEKEVELILAGEQHSLTTIPTQNSTHDTRTEFYSKNTRQESKTNSNWHNHEHSREFHRKHPNLLNPFNEDEQTTTHTHHRHSHNRAYHQRHPELPNPFATPEAPQSTTNFELSNTNVPNPHAESTTPFSVRPGTDVRVGDTDCQFDCGNGNCVKTHDVCNGINNCGNRKDEENCKHLGYEVRLTGGETSNMGRIEVKLLGKWGYVCDDKFGLSDAEVVCRELGFKLGASEVRGFSYYPPTTADVSFAMDEVECRGDEASLKECNFKGWGVSNCGPDEVVGVVCKVPQLKCPNNYWLCSTSQECIPPAFLCDNTPDCADKSDESENVCNSPIKYRLQGGPSPNEGRLEVRYRGEWGTVCDDDFGLKEAQVMCNSMGFYGTTTIVKNKYGPGSGPIWLDQVSCYGNETTLDQCNHFTWGEHNCNHTEDVGLKCTLGVPPQKIVTPPQVNDYENTQRELDETQQQLEDIGLFSEQWERKSKAVGEQRRCGQFKNDILDEYSHPEERVVNGSIAKRGHHPWQATIRTRGRGGISSHWCGAVLISSRHLLTAAHCLAGYPKGAYLVRLGDHYANIAESSEVDSFIENWYVHEKFRDATHMNNDIAVVVLKTPVKFNDYIQPVCLPNKGAALEENRKCTISGWGSIKSGVSTPSNILRAAELPILSDEVCKQKHVYGSSLTEGMFCAGYMDESVDACDGDSGGPLICHDEDGETLYGIISWGQHCGYANKPGVYVRVEKYVDWILEKINFSMQKNNKL